jgi:hypothetical protein
MLGILLNMEKHQVEDESSKRMKRSSCVLNGKVCSTVLVAMRDVARCSFENVTIARGFYEAKERSWRYDDFYIIKVCPALRDMGYKLVEETVWYQASIAYPLGRPHYQIGDSRDWRRDSDDYVCLQHKSPVDLMLLPFESERISSAGLGFTILVNRKSDQSWVQDGLLFPERSDQLMVCFTLT